MMAIMRKRSGCANARMMPDEIRSCSSFAVSGDGVGEDEVCLLMFFYVMTAHNLHGSYWRQICDILCYLCL